MPATIMQVTFDARDAAALASFYSAVLERPVEDGASPFFATIGYEDRTSGQLGLMFLQVPEGPSGSKNRVHLDLQASLPLAEETERLVGLGATHVRDVEEHGHRWATFTDPEGNVLDVGVAPFEQDA